MHCGNQSQIGLSGEMSPERHLARLLAAAFFPVNRITFTAAKMYVGCTKVRIESVIKCVSHNM